MLFVMKFFVFVIFVVIFVLGIYGMIKVIENFDRRMLVKDDFVFLKFLNVWEKYYE